ncbi:MAG TPA: DUF4386 domain-containing protein [Roseateles sp.]
MHRDSLNTYARLAGLSYVTFTLCGVVRNFFLNTKLHGLEDVQGKGLFVNELQYRLGIGLETLMFVATLLASFALYEVMKAVNPRRSLLALCFRLCEVIVGSMAVVASLFMLSLATKAQQSAAFNTEQLAAFLTHVSSLRVPAFEYSWIFMGIAGLVTFHLFYQARLMPRWLSAWGLFTYAGLIAYPMAKMLVPDLPKQVMWVIYPGALCELVIGAWLMVKGVAAPAAGRVGS